MEWIEFGKTIANLGLIPALGIACIVIWRKWWDMVDKLVTKYEAVIKKKDAEIEKLQARNDELGEKRIEEYRSVITDYRDTLQETNRRDDQLAAGQKANQRLLEALAGRPPGSTT